MKKIIALILVLLIGVSMLAACGEKETPATNPTSDTQTTPDTTTTPAPTPTPTPEPTPVPNDIVTWELEHSVSGTVELLYALEIPGEMAYREEEGEDYQLFDNSKFNPIVAGDIYFQLNVGNYSSSSIRSLQDDIVSVLKWKEWGATSENLKEITINGRNGYEVHDDSNRVRIVLEVPQIADNMCLTILFKPTDENASIAELYASENVQTIVNSITISKLGVGDGSTIVVEKGDEGEGPSVLDTKFLDVTMPADMQYEVKLLPVESEFGGVTSWQGTLEIKFGVGNTNQGNLMLSTTRMISSLDDAVGECFRSCTFTNALEGEEFGEVTFAGVTYRIVKIYGDDDRETCDIKTYLIGYYNNGNDDIYIQISVNERDSFGSRYQIDLDNPKFVEMMNSIVYK